MIKGVIYDMDDLMVNSAPLHTEAWERLLEKHGHKFSELPEDMQAAFIGKRVIDITAEIADYFKLTIDTPTLFEERMEAFLEVAKDKLESMPGLHESLELFKKNNLRIALASSGTKIYINLVLDKFAIRQYFEVIISGEDVDKGKPDPETYRVAVNKLGLKPEECVVLEDATVGIAAAKGAGCKCIALINPNTPPQDHSKADKVVNSLNEISIETIRSL